jgi:hypothetical protein
MAHGALIHLQEEMSVLGDIWYGDAEISIRIVAYDPCASITYGYTILHSGRTKFRVAYPLLQDQWSLSTYKPYDDTEIVDGQLVRGEIESNSILFRVPVQPGSIDPDAAGYQICSLFRERIDDRGSPFTHHNRLEESGQIAVVIQQLQPSLT